MRHGVVALALLALWGSTARADAVTDCNQDKDVDRAIRGCTALIRQNPTNSPAFFLRAGRHMDKGDFYNAIADYNKVLGFNPKDASMYQSRGVAHLANGNFDKAIEDYTRAIELNPDDPIRYLAYAGRGRAYEDKGQKDRAIEDFRRALSMQPDSQDAKDGLRRLGASP